jgi:7-keto-8-aminopelargonate synthetase-like enzyme
VPLKAARLRFFITSEHTAAQIRMAVATMREELDGLGRRQQAA